MTDDQYSDVILIGTGAGGGIRVAPWHTVSRAPAKQVLLLERGTICPGSGTTGIPALSSSGARTEPEFWLDKEGREFPPEVNYFVGGNTTFYGVALFRLRPEDFGELRHHGGISPAWPIRYEDLEPYYTEAEHLYLVHGVSGARRAARIPPRDSRAPRTSSLRCSTSRGSSDSVTTWRSWAGGRSTPCGSATIFADRLR